VRKRAFPWFASQNHGIVLNPAKTKKTTFTELDRIIVQAES
jgi:hypothetical protein